MKKNNILLIITTFLIIIYFSILSIVFVDFFNDENFNDPTINPSIENSEIISLPEPSLENSVEPTLVPSASSEPTVEPTPVPSEPELTIEPTPDVSQPTDEPSIPDATILPTIEVIEEYFDPMLISYEIDITDEMFMVLDDYKDFDILKESNNFVYENIDIDILTPLYFENNYLVVFISEEKVLYNGLQIANNIFYLNLSSELDNQFNVNSSLKSDYTPLLKPDKSYINTLLISKTYFNINRDYEIYIDHKYVDLNYSCSYLNTKADLLYKERFNENQNSLYSLYENANYDVVLFNDNDNSNEELFFLSESLKLDNNQSIFVLTNNSILTFDEAKNINIFRMDIFKSIKDKYYENTYLDDFKNAYCNKYNVKNIDIEMYNGTFKNVMCALFKEEKTTENRREIIDGVTINYKDNRNMFVYDLNEIYTLKEAYEKSIIDRFTLIDIANKYNNEEFDYLHSLSDLFDKYSVKDIKEVQFRFNNKKYVSNPLTFEVYYINNKKELEKVYSDLLYVKFYKAEINDYLNEYENEKKEKEYYSLAIVTGEDIYDFEVSSLSIMNNQFYKSDIKDYINLDNYDSIQYGYSFYETTLNVYAFSNYYGKFDLFTYLIFNINLSFYEKKYMSNDIILKGNSSNLEIIVYDYDDIKITYVDSAKRTKYYKLVGYLGFDDANTLLTSHSLNLYFIKVIYNDGKLDREFYSHYNHVYSKEELLDILKKLNHEAIDISTSKDFSTEIIEYVVGCGEKIYIKEVN